MKLNYTLAAKINNQIMEIDWTKISKFKDLKKDKYKLNKIDFFTSHYPNHEYLLISLLDENILTFTQLKKVKLQILVFKNKNETKNYLPEYSYDDLLYKDSHEWILKDYYIIALLSNLIDDSDFVEYLYMFYVINGKYNKYNIQILNSKIQQINNKIINGYTTLKGLKACLDNEFAQLNTSYLLLNKIYTYKEKKKNNFFITLAEKNIIENCIQEFFYREKYIITDCKQGTYENNILTFKKDKNNNRYIKQRQYHELLVLIQSYIKQVKDNAKFEKEKEYELPIQLKLF